MLVNMKEMLEIAQKNKYAVACINTPNLETLIGVISAAEELNVPVIIDHAQVHDSIVPLEFIAPYMIEYAKKAKVPVCVHLDHAKSYNFVMRAIRLGFTSIMYDCSDLPFEENVSRVKEFVKIAHDLNITVEGELGVMTAEGNNDTSGLELSYTDPKAAKKFIDETNVDALAVCFGTVHGVYTQKPILDIERLKEIKAEVGEAKLVMHGASGVDFKQTQEAISNGISKINYYTYLSNSVAPKLVEMINSKDSVYFHDISLYATEVLKQGAKEVLTAFQNKVKA